MRVSPILAAVLAAPTLSMAAPAGMSCSYLGPDRAFAEGTCRLDEADDRGRYAFSASVGPYLVRVVEIDRQGQWSRVLINGKPGAGFEINRTHRAYSTDDLTVAFEYEAR